MSWCRCFYKHTTGVVDSCRAFSGGWPIFIDYLALIFSSCYLFISLMLYAEFKNVLFIWRRPALWWEKAGQSRRDLHVHSKCSREYNKTCINYLFYLCFMPHSRLIDLYVWGTGPVFLSLPFHFLIGWIALIQKPEIKNHAGMGKSHAYILFAIPYCKATYL